MGIVSIKDSYGQVLTMGSLLKLLLTISLASSAAAIRCYECNDENGYAAPCGSPGVEQVEAQCSTLNFVACVQYQFTPEGADTQVYRMCMERMNEMEVGRGL